MVAAFDGGAITSDAAGTPLLSETDRARLIERFSACLRSDVRAGPEISIFSLTAGDLGLDS